jgi:hypothetical protein
MRRGGVMQDQRRHRPGCWQRRKPDQVRHEIDNNVTLPATVANLAERFS